MLWNKIGSFRGLRQVPRRKLSSWEQVQHSGTKRTAITVGNLTYTWFKELVLFHIGRKDLSCFGWSDKGLRGSCSPQCWSLSVSSTRLPLWLAVIFSDTIQIKGPRGSGGWGQPWGSMAIQRVQGVQGRSSCTRGPRGVQRVQEVPWESRVFRGFIWSKNRGRKNDKHIQISRYTLEFVRNMELSKMCIHDFQIKILDHLDFCKPLLLPPLTTGWHNDFKFCLVFVPVRHRYHNSNAPISHQ